MPPPPLPPPPVNTNYSSEGYYSSNAGSSSSSAARQRLGLQNNTAKNNDTAAATTASSSSDDWFASPAPPAPAAAAPSSGSGFYSMNNANTTAGGGDTNNSMYNNNYGASSSTTAYGGGGGSSNNAMGSSSGSGGGYYGGSSAAAATTTGGGYGGQTNNAMSGSIGGGIGAPSSNIPPSSAFGSNPNSGSTGQIMNNTMPSTNSYESMGGNSWDSTGGGGAIVGGAMSGTMGGPIGGATSTASSTGISPTLSSTPAPHVFDPNAAAAQKAEQHNTMQAMEEDYENEPPLLEELGVNFPHIYSKSHAVLFPIGKHAKSLESGFIENDADLAGPLAFALGLGGELLLSGKLHFGYVYGFGVSGCLAMTLLLNLLNPNGAVSVWTVISILGYSLLPVNLLAGMNAFVRIHKLGKFGMVMAVLTIVWSTMASARLFERGCNMRAQRFLVAYPTALLYSAFVMLTIF